MKFDFRNPDYVSVFRRRLDALGRIRANPQEIPSLKLYYRDHPADFINDWGCTFDPRLVERGLPAYVPFLLFERQREWVDWVIKCWKTQKPGLTEKSRDMGMSWLSVGLACTICLFYEGVVVGFGSRLVDLVDKSDDPISLFYKARMFMESLPPEFTGGWRRSEHSAFLRIQFPSTGSHISGEGGDNIGRGNRASIYFVDESAHIARPQLVEASLSQTTNCRIDMSSVNGMANAFAEKRHSGRVEVFTFHWRMDPRKDDEWYQKQVAELDPVTVAQEIDLNYSASVEGVLIPSAWVQASINAHIKMQVLQAGALTASLDVADEGRDMNALCGTHGILLTTLEEWSGAGSNIYATTERAFNLCCQNGYTTLRYDADGLGSAVRGDAEQINKGRVQKLHVEAFRGSAAVFNPEGEDVRGRKNQDMFANAKAQAWWALRCRFERTYQAVSGGVVASHDDLISIPTTLPMHHKLMTELSQPTYSINGAGKIVIDKTPDGARSPNLADAVMIQFSVVRKPAMRFTPAMLRAI